MTVTSYWHWAAAGEAASKVPAMQAIAQLHQVFGDMALPRTGVRQVRRNDGRDLPEMSTSNAFEAHGPFGRYFEYIVSLTVGG